MKKFHLIACLVLCMFFRNELVSNPIVVYPPQAFVSELVFDPSHTWTLELEMFIDINLPLSGVIDSIVLQSNTSRAKLVFFPAAHYALFNITAADLNAPFMLNYLQDTLRVTTYADSSQYFFGPAVNTHMLVYGYPGCEIPTVLAGQSISARERDPGNPRYFYLDNSPTIGLQNDTTGATSILTGKFYDVRGDLISAALYQQGFALPANVEPDYWGLQVFYAPLAEFAFDAQGNYSTTFLSRNTVTSGINYLHGDYSPYGYSISELLPCEEFTFFVEPGSVMSHDIHLADSTFLVGIQDPQDTRKKDISIICAPNPVSQSGTFFITADEPVEDAEIVIYSAGSSVVCRLAVPQANKCSITFSRDRLGAAGLYFYSLVQHGKRTRTGEIICQ